MDKEIFNLKTIPEQIEYVNQLLKDGQSLRTISDNLNLSKSTIRERAKKIGYTYNDVLKAYTSELKEVIQIPPKDETNQLAKQEDTKNDSVDKSIDKEPKQDTKQDDSLKFSIPNKTKKKDDTQAFNIVMKRSLVKTIDKLSHKKGYSRTQMISLLCEMILNNMEED